MRASEIDRATNPSEIVLLVVSLQKADVLVAQEAPTASVEPGNPSGGLSHGHRVIQLSDSQTAVQVLQKEPILARFRIRVTAIEFWPELVCPRQNVTVRSDLVPHSTSVPVTRVVNR